MFRRCCPKSCEEEKHAYMLSTASFFGGMLLMRLLIALTHLLDPDHDRELLGHGGAIFAERLGSHRFPKQHVPGRVDIPVAYSCEESHSGRNIEP